MDNTAIITTTITAIATVVVAVSNIYMNSQRKKDKEEAKRMAEKNAAKSSIQNMITQDIIRTEILGKTPENYKAILEEFDDYTTNGGNSYIKGKVDDYCEWFEEQEAKLTKK